MSSKIWFGLLAAALLLSACAVSRTGTPITTQAAQSEPTAVLEVQPPQEAPPPTPTSPSTPTQTEADDLPPVPSGCTVVSQKYSPEPTQQSIFPPVNNSDWIIGPESAVVTLIEYGDFQ